MIPAFPNQQQPGVSEAGTIANPTQLEVYQEKRRESPDQEYGYGPRVTPGPESTRPQGQEQQEAAEPGTGAGQNQQQMQAAMEQAGSENVRYPAQEAQEADLGRSLPARSPHSGSRPCSRGSAAWDGALIPRQR